MTTDAGPLPTSTTPTTITATSTTLTSTTQSMYVDGPRLSTVAADVCSIWTGTLAEAQALCDATSDCFVVWDYDCNLADWRYCSGPGSDIKTLTDTGPGTDSCTMIKQGGTAAPTPVPTPSPLPPTVVPSPMPTPVPPPPPGCPVCPTPAPTPVPTTLTNVYVDGPRVSNYQFCSVWWGTEEQAKAQCDADTTCTVIWDYACDNKGWRFCPDRALDDLPGGNIGLMNFGWGDTMACTKVVDGTIVNGSPWVAPTSGR